MMRFFVLHGNHEKQRTGLAIESFEKHLLELYEDNGDDWMSADFSS